MQVGARHLGTDLGKGVQRCPRWMSETVSRPYADDRVVRSPTAECGWYVAVLAPMMRDLHHRDRRRPCIRHAVLSSLLGIAQEQCPHASPLQQEHDARVVRVQARLASARPQYAHGRLPHHPAHPPAQTRHRTRPARASELKGVHRRIDDVGQPDPRGCRDAGKTIEAADVVIMGVREDDRIERTDTRSGQCLAEDHGIGTRIHEQRVRPIPDDDRVPLSNVQHSDTRLSRYGEERRDSQGDRDQ